MMAIKSIGIVGCGAIGKALVQALWKTANWRCVWPA